MGKSMEKLNPQRQRQRFGKEFKLNAVKLLKTGQKPGTQIALELGIRRNQLYKWAATLEAKSGDITSAFNGSGRKPAVQQVEAALQCAQPARRLPAGADPARPSCQSWCLRCAQDMEAFASQWRRLRQTSHCATTGKSGHRGQAQAALSRDGGAPQERTSLT